MLHIYFSVLFIYWGCLKNNVVITTNCIYISNMKKAHTFRFNKVKVDEWKIQAKKENRTLTNFIETVLNKYISENKISDKK